MPVKYFPNEKPNICIPTGQKVWFSAQKSQNHGFENVIFCSKMMYPEQSVHVNRVFKVGYTFLMFCKVFPHGKIWFACRNYKKLVIFQKKILKTRKMIREKSWFFALTFCKKNIFQNCFFTREML